MYPSRHRGGVGSLCVAGGVGGEGGVGRRGWSRWRGWSRRRGWSTVGVDVVVIRVVVARVSYLPVEDREELSRALSEQVREMEDMWRSSMLLVSSI
jgi:hypothetical protein